MTLTNAEAAYERALRGDFVALEATRDGLAGAGPDGALRLAFDALYGLVAPERAGRVEAEAIARHFVEEASARWASDALTHLATGALLAFDGARMTRIASAMADVASPRATRAIALINGWDALMRGDALGALGEASTTSRLAKQERSSTGLVAAATLEALALVEVGRIDEATTVARRASRMARTERLLVQEYLANIALARVRRYAGRAHLAARIASALDQVAPPPWRSWLRWELSLAGQRVASSSDDTPGAWLAGALDAAERGDHDAFAERAAGCRHAASGFARMAAEADALLLLTDPLSPATTHPVTGAFARAETDDAPYGLRDRNVGATTGALVLARPDGVSRRVLRTGVPLLGDEAWTPPEGNQKDARTHALVAVLGVAGEAGLEEGRAFRAVYGFDMIPVKHDGVFRTLRHRAKTILGDGAALEREAGRLRLVPHLPILCPDPRTQLPNSERILALLAAGHGRVTAKQIATALSIAVRSVQAALGELVDEGACVAERIGRKVEYGVEDTTFYEPSLHRLAARAPGSSA